MICLLLLPGIHYLAYVASDACLAFEPVNSLKVNSLWTMLEISDKVGHSVTASLISGKMASSTARISFFLSAQPLKLNVECTKAQTSLCIFSCAEKKPSTLIK